MSNTLTAAAILLEQQVENLPFRSNEMAKQAALEIIQDLAVTTPVDTGKALSNWQVTLETPAESIVPPFIPSQKGKNVGGKWQHRIDPSITRQSNASELIAQASSIIAGKQPGQDLFITNNLEYIGILNQGSSDQAPAGFIDRANAIAQSVLDSGAKLG